MDAELSSAAAGEDDILETLLVRKIDEKTFQGWTNRHARLCELNRRKTGGTAHLLSSGLLPSALESHQIC
jgi:hypothetical protein